MPYPSPSIPRPAKKQELPEHSSRRSNTVSKNSVRAAESAADRAFGTKRALPLSSDTPAVPADQQGRHRLKDSYWIEIKRVQPDPAQPRKKFDPAKLQELADSIAQIGFLQPLTVRWDETLEKYVIINGERRWRAAQLAGKPEVPCWVKKPDSDRILLHQLSENWQRADLHPFEIADSIAQLRDLDYTQEQIAKLTGKNQSEVSKLLALLNLDPEVQKAAREDGTGTLTRRHLYATAKLAEAHDQRELIDTIREEQLTAEETEKIVAEKKGRRPKKKGAPVTQKRFATSKATVAVTFRKKHVSDADVIAALKEVMSELHQAKAKTRKPGKAAA